MTRPVSIAALLDSADFSLPDTSEFTLKKYRVSFTPDYVARPNIGYTRDNFGRGFYGGSAISLSDMLGNHQLVFAGYVNGHVNEAQILAAYANLSHRINWATGHHPGPVLLPGAELRSRPATGPARDIFVTNIRRLIVRSVFASAYYPVSRFQRIETGLRFANVDDAHPAGEGALRSVNGVPHRRPVPRHRQSAGRDLRPADRGAGVRQLADRVRESVLRPSLPDRGRPLDRRAGRSPRSTSTIGATIGSSGRSCSPAGSLYYGRMGRDASEFRIFAGSTDLIRGNTSGSYRRNECLNAARTIPDRLRRARPAGGHPAGGGLVRAAHAALQPVARTVPAILPPMELPCSTTWA